MLNIDFSTFPILHTERLILKEMTTDDVKVLFEMRSNSDLMKYIDRPKPKTIEDIHELIERMRQMKINGEGISWGIYRKENPNLNIGNIGFFRIIADHYRAEVGYMLQANEHRKGVMFEAMHTVIKFGFEKMHLHSIEANINPENEASRKLLEKAGFVREAYFRENYFFEGRFIDTEIYSLISK